MLVWLIQVSAWKTKQKKRHWTQAFWYHHITICSCVHWSNQIVRWINALNLKVVCRETENLKISPRKGASVQKPEGVFRKKKVTPDNNNGIYGRLVFFVFFVFSVVHNFSNLFQVPYFEFETSSDKLQYLQNKVRQEQEKCRNQSDTNFLSSWNKKAGSFMDANYNRTTVCLMLLMSLLDSPHSPHVFAWFSCFCLIFLMFFAWFSCLCLILMFCLILLMSLLDSHVFAWFSLCLCLTLMFLRDSPYVFARFSLCLCLILQMSLLDSHVFAWFSLCFCSILLMSLLDSPYVFVWCFSCLRLVL